MKVTTQIGEIFVLSNENDNVNIDLHSEQLLEGLEIVKISIDAPESKQFSTIELTWNYPIIDFHSYWHPTSGRSKNFYADWCEGKISNSTFSAPVASFYNIAGQNKFTCAFSDALYSINFNFGIHEEDGSLKCRIILFTQPTKPMTHYEAELRIDTRNIPYYEALFDVSKWWESFKQYKPVSIPEIARMPMYSTWYSFHQELSDKEIEAQCVIAKKLGCEAIIVDDGWQTSDNHRGYAYTGDWQVALDKIPDMKQHVKRVHQIGLKYLLWYSVPFVGVKSNVWQQFKDKVLIIESHGGAVLDPRYPDVREYTIKTYEKALIDWDLDGFKLDFVDCYNLPAKDAKKYDERRDFESIQEAVDKLLTDIMKRLKKIKPNIMIEFRQPYIGPYMRKYGNMFRVGDCPNDFINNRVGISDIRLLCGNTAPHSDMVMWCEKDTVESTALQMANIIFSVPQFSMDFKKLSKEHFQMASYWLNFIKENRDVLLDGDFKPLFPELLYPIISSSTNKKRVIAIYSDFYIKTGTQIPNELILVNGTLNNEIILKAEEYMENRVIKIVDCCGKIINEKTITLNKGLHTIQVPAVGIVFLKK